MSLPDGVLEQSLINLVERESLKLIFVGGKGGVGKTTVACSIAIKFASLGYNTLIMSTDPAHSLKDCFKQRISHEPTVLKHIENLSAVEVDPAKDNEKKLNETAQSSSNSFFDSLMSQVVNFMPAMDEASFFTFLMSSIGDYDKIIVDTAPTGHALKFLTMSRGISSISNSGVSSMIMDMMGSMNLMEEDSKEEFANTLSNSTEAFDKVLKSSKLTTFVAVGIPTLMSLYETERLIMSLVERNIDVSNVVINQVRYPDEDVCCKHCESIRASQIKYILQYLEFYCDTMHVTTLPIFTDEIIKIDRLSMVSDLLFTYSNVFELFSINPEDVLDEDEF
ncbi:hypothetical protein PCE1_004079 [Barthelona sp. PCE]